MCFWLSYWNALWLSKENKVYFVKWLLMFFKVSVNLKTKTVPDNEDNWKVTFWRFKEMISLTFSCKCGVYRVENNITHFCIMVLNRKREKVITVENIDSIHQVSFLQSYYIEDCLSFPGRYMLVYKLCYLSAKLCHELLNIAVYFHLKVYVFM